MKRIIIKTGDGKVTFEAEGFSGSSCERTLKGFIQRTGGEADAPELLPEYFQQETNTSFEAEFN